MPTAVPPVNPVNPVPDAPTPPEGQNALDAMHLVKARVAGDTVNKATAELPDDQRSLIRWLHTHACEHNLNQAETAALVRLSDSTISRLFRGNYEGSIASVCKEIADFKRLYEARQHGRPLSFIETSLTRRIWSVCDLTLEMGRVSLIIGESQTGKTKALEEYTRTHNHGSTIYTRMTTGGTITHFLDELCRALRIGLGSPAEDKRRRVIDAFDDRMLLIVDEVHQAVIFARTSVVCLKTLEFIREIHDRTGCGLVLCGTNAFLKEMQEGRMADVLRQTRRRRACILHLPDSPSPEDLAIIADKYGLPPAAGDALETQAAVVASEGLGMWLCVLRHASKLCAARKRKLDWPGVQAAYKSLQKMEGSLPLAA